MHICVCICVSGFTPLCTNRNAGSPSQDIGCPNLFTQKAASRAAAASSICMILVPFRSKSSTSSRMASAICKSTHKEISSRRKDQLRIVTGSVSIPFTGFWCQSSGHKQFTNRHRSRNDTSAHMIGGFTHRVPYDCTHPFCVNKENPIQLLAKHIHHIVPFKFAMYQNVEANFFLQRDTPPRSFLDKCVVLLIRHSAAFPSGTVCTHFCRLRKKEPMVVVGSNGSPKTSFAVFRSSKSGSLTKSASRKALSFHEPRRSRSLDLSNKRIFSQTQHFLPCSRRQNVARLFKFRQLFLRKRQISF